MPTNILNDFCAFILTHGRPDQVKTYHTVRRLGYTGPLFLVVDDEDPTQADYCQKYGDEVLIFSKEKIAQTFDEADNFHDRRAIVYARNACFNLAEQLGYRYFVQLDDDYNFFTFRTDAQGNYNSKRINNLDRTFQILLDFFKSTPCLSVAMMQGGDFIGGPDGKMAKKICLKRKAMNSFFCSTDRRFTFIGRVNEDVTSYTTLGSRGHLFFSVNLLALTQAVTQQHSGGMSELYQNQGTYIKSFYTVIQCPSSVKIGTMGYISPRIHHHINWVTTVPQVISEKYRKHEGKEKARATQVSD